MNSTDQTTEDAPFAWYEEKDMDTLFSQGDIIKQFPVPSIVRHAEFPFFKAVGALYDVVVMTQACDLEQNRVDEITLCVIEPVEFVVKEILIHEARVAALKNGTPEKDINNDELIDFASLSNGQKGKAKGILNKIKQGNYTDYYLLNRNVPGDNSTNISMDFKIVLLRQVYRIPISSAEELMTYLNETGGQGKRLRLLPPYREHLAQTFANTFSRIGLPIDVNKEHMETDVLSRLSAL